MESNPEQALHTLEDNLGWLYSKNVPRFA